MDLLIEVPELAACVAEEELALDPDSEAKDVGKEQSAVERDALKMVVKDKAAPGSEEAQMSVATRTALAIIGILSARTKERHRQNKSGEASASPRKEGERRYPSSPVSTTTSGRSSLRT